MQHRTLVTCLAALSLPMVAMAQQPAPAKGTKRRALLVAIQDYPAPGPDDPRDLPEDLHGPRNDIAFVQRILQQNFGFAKEDIRTLLDEKATHENLARELHELGKQCDQDTQALFWFSGHGSRVRDASGREGNKGMSEEGGTGSFDGSLICYDSRNDPLRNRDFSDDELYSLMRGIARRAAHTVLVTDACYSGGAVRGDGSRRVRGHSASLLPWDEEFARKALPPGVKLLDDDDEQREVDRRAGLRYTHIAACSDDELAWEYEIKEGRHYGTLTYFLGTAMSGATAPRSWRELALRTRANVAATKPQTVWFEGMLDVPVFGGTFQPTPPGFAATGLRGGRVEVDAGRLHGLGPNCEVELFDFANQRVGTAKADRIHAASAVFTFVGTAPKDLHQLAFVARPAANGSSRAPLRLALDPTLPTDLLGGNPWTIVAPDGSDGAVVTAGGQLWLRDPEGYLARPLAAGREPRTLDLFREHAYRTLRELVAAPGRLQVNLTLAPPQPVGEESKIVLPPATTQLRTDGRITAIAPWMDEDEGGAALELLVENPGSEPVHVTVLSVCEDRSVYIAWPAEGQRDNVLGPRDSRRFAFAIGPNRSWQPSRPMVDRYLAIATSKYADFHPFTSKATLDDLAPKRSGDGDRTGTLPPLLAVALAGQTTRGISATDYGVAYLDVLLPKPK